MPNLVVAPTSVKGRIVRFIDRALRPLSMTQETNPSSMAGYQDLFDDPAEPVDLVDEQDVVFAELGQDGDHVSGSLDSGA